MSIVPTTDRDGPALPDARAAATIWSSSSLTLRAPDAPARPFSQVRFPSSRVTEIACFDIL
jgi:hypothetical protein